MSMINDQRRIDTGSPKSSPRGSRSPAYPRQDSTGLLKTTITLGRNPTVFQAGNFYLMEDLPKPAELTGSTNLMSYYNLESSYNKFVGKKLRPELSAFLPSLPGNIDAPGHEDNSSLRSLIEKPPITGKELHPLTSSQLSAFRLHPGPLPERFKLMSQAPQKPKKHKKKHKREAKDMITSADGIDVTMEAIHDHKKQKKLKRNDEEREQRRKKRKEKKKKREKEKEEKS